jgi:POT family proton-dependent oligopeptide transporter
MASARDIDLVQADVDIQRQTHLHSAGGDRVYPLSSSEAKAERSSIVKRDSSERDNDDTQTESGSSIELDAEGNAMIEPTQEELATLRRVADKIPIAAFSVVIVELCERFAYYGLSGPFQNYLENPLPDGGPGTGAPPKGSTLPAGALNRGQTAATGLNNMFQVSNYFSLP